MGKRKSMTNDAEFPLWEFIERVRRGEGGGGNVMCRCKFCAAEFNGSYTRVKAHLLLIKGRGVAVCTGLDDENTKKMRRLQDIADAVAQMPKPCIADISLPKTEEYGQKTRKGDGGLSALFNASARDELDHLIARAFFGCGFPFNAIRSPLVIKFIQFACDNSLKGYIPPTADRLRTVLLDDEIKHIEKLLQPIKSSWKRTGVSIISDGWTDNNSRPLINFMGTSASGPVFLKAIDTSGNLKDAAYIASLFLDVIAEVGPANVVQISTDNAPVMKSAATLVETAHPHIFWTPCVVHTLNLALKDLCDPTQRDISRFEKCSWIKELIAEARTIKIFVANHGHALSIYNKYEKLRLLSIAETRFASNIIMLRRLNDVKSSLVSMVVDEDWKFYKGDDNKKAQLIKNTIVDDSWWEKVRYLLSLVMPMINMLRRCDTDKPSLHLVYDMWDAMIEETRLIIYKHEEKDVATDESSFYTEVHDILVSRWNKSNTPLICLAHSLNPKFYSDEWLEQGNGLSRVAPHRDEEISTGRNNCFERIFPNLDDRKKVKEEYGKFSGCMGSFGNWESQKDRFTDEASAWWNNYGASAPTLAVLADRLLNQPCSSSCCERNWSTYAFIQNVKRNHLDPKRAESLVHVHSSLRLLSRQEESYTKGTTKYWDVLFDETSMEGPSELEIANLDFMEIVPIVSPPNGEEAMVP